MYLNAREIYLKTIKFAWMKLLLGIITIFISVILLAVFLGLGLLFGEGIALFTLIMWLVATGVVRLIIMHYFGYLVKAGHIAVITTAIATGQVPENQFEVGKEMVKERFVTSNVYFAVDKMVAGAVKQLQNVLDKAGDFLGAVPGINVIMSIGKLFLSVSLGYIDECCLGYTFYKKEQNVFQSAADGVVIYAQNWKQIMKDAAVTTAVVIALLIGITLAVFLMFGAAFKIIGWNGYVAFILSVFVTLVVKSAFIDSWVMVKMMCLYMGIAPNTEITFDLYQKLCGLSSKFKKLFERGKSEIPEIRGEGVPML